MTTKQAIKEDISSTVTTKNKEAEKLEASTIQTENDSSEASSDVKTPRLIKRLGGAANTLWQANLGAAIIIEAQAEKIFKTLVAEGKAYQNPPRSDDSNDKVHVIPSASEVKDIAFKKIHNIEHKIDRGVNNTLHWIGIPSRNDFMEMSSQVSDLSESLAILTRQLKENLNIENEIH